MPGKLQTQDDDARLSRVPIVLIRHGHAGARPERCGDDRLRPLSRRGHRPADRRPEGLRSYTPGGCCSAYTPRCVQTVNPLADGLGWSTETTGHLAEGTSPYPALPDDQVALCTHGPEASEGRPPIPRSRG